MTVNNHTKMIKKIRPKLRQKYRYYVLCSLFLNRLTPSYVTSQNDPIANDVTCGFRSRRHDFLLRRAMEGEDKEEDEVNDDAADDVGDNDTKRIMRFFAIRNFVSLSIILWMCCASWFPRSAASHWQ